MEILHPEWETALESVNHMDESDEIIDDPEFRSPSLFIELDGFGESLVIRHPNNRGMSVDTTILPKTTRRAH